MDKKYKIIIAISIVAIVLGSVIAYKYIQKHSKEVLILATTTSLYDSGLLEYLEPIFEEKYNIELHIISTGTGIAIQYAENGDVDVLLIHDKAREEKFVQEEHGINRRSIAYNYFIIIGAKDDHAKIKNLTPEDAFKKIKDEGTKNSAIKFISRGDESGTHSKEKAIWKNAGYNYSKDINGNWYLSAGKGMGETLRMANELSAYTLTDIGTFLSYEGKLELVPLVEKGASLLNVYSVIAVNPSKHNNVNIKMANNFITFLMSNETQELIDNFGVKKYEQQLFHSLVGDEKYKNVGATWDECNNYTLKT